MHQKQTRDLLIRDLPIEMHNLLENAAKQHHRSKAQEAIVVLSQGLKVYTHRVSQPKPFKWKKRISNRLIEESIQEDRE